jgi:hypothetical protein
LEQRAFGQKTHKKKQTRQNPNHNYTYSIYMTMMRSPLTCLIFAYLTSASASFLRSPRTQEQQQEQKQQHSLSVTGGDALSKFGIDTPAPFKNQDETRLMRAWRGACPEKPCLTLNYFKYINPDIIETEFHCTSAANCEFACLYDNTTFQCEEDLLDTMKYCDRCKLPCVKDDCDDFKMCLSLGSIVNDLVGMSCTTPEDCPLGECRYVDQNQTLLCDDAYGSLCGYHCVEEDSGTIPPFP